MNYSDLNTEQQMIAEIKKYVNNKALDVQSDWNESDSSVGNYIKNKPTLGTAAALDVASSGDASSSQVVKGNDSRLTDSRNAADVYSWAKAPSKPSYTASEVGAIATTAKGVANGVATLDNNGFIPSSQLPSYVDDAIEGYYYNSKFYKESTHTTEIIGETGKIYIDLSTDKTYRWSGSIYVEINKSQLIQASSTNGNIKIDGTETTVYTHPGSGTNPHGTTKNDVGLGNVDNTSDANKPISTATQTALNNKVDKVAGKGLSTEDFTNNFKKGIAISQELAYDRATIPQPNLDADFHTVNGERSVIYQGNAYTFHTMTYNPILKKYVYGILCNPVYQGGLFFCEVDNPASDRHNWLDTTTFPTDILINSDIYTAVMPTGKAYYVAYSYNNNDEKELVYSDALDSSRFDYWVKTEIIIDSIFNIGNYVFYVADNKVYKYEFAHGSVELDFDTVPFAYTYGGGRCIALTKNQYNVISAFMSYDGIEWTKVNFPSINKTNKPSGLIYDHGIFLFYQEDDEYVITSKDGFSWEKHKLSIDMTEFRENFMIFDEIGWGGGIFYACVNSVDEGHYDDYTIWTSQDGYTWEQTVKYLEDEIHGKTDYYNGTYLISVAQNLYYPTYRLDGVYGKGDVYTKTESDNKYVAKETGKGLSTNDYTTTDKNKLAGIEAEANKTVVDSAMSDSSTNPLQNKVITKELEGSKTVAGNPITVTDAAPVNAVNLSMDLEPIQAGSGTPSPDNIRPITGQTEVTIEDCGKNYIYIENGTLENDATKSVQPRRCRTGNMCYITANTDYVISASTLSGKIINISYQIWESNSFGSNTKLYDSGWQNVPIIINLSNNKWITFVVKYSDESNISFEDLNIQLEKGTTATDFEPYKGKTYTIQFGQTVYGCHYDVTRGKMVVDRGYKVYDGSSDESWNSDHVGYRVFVQIADIKPDTINAITNRYKYVTTGETYQGLSGFSIDSNILLIGCLGYSVADWETYLANNPLQVCYELATPYTIDLTPQQIQMLENTNTIYTDYEGDTITIEYQPNNAIGEAVRVAEENYETRVSLLESRNTAKVYGFHISSTESDPSAKVTYLADAVGMTPAKMNFSTGKFDYGSWEDVWFVRDTKPCLLNINGNVDLYLDKNDFTKDEYGNGRLISENTQNLMIEFPKIWYKVVPDSDGYGASVYIAPIKIDEDYVDYPYIDYLGRHKEHFYMSAYNGSTVTTEGTTRMRSFPGDPVNKSNTAQQEINYCKANGSGWNTEDAGSIMLINFLLILMGKSTDTQTVFGQGLHTGSTEAINDGFRTGIHNQKGMFYGTNSGTIASNSYGNAVKVFGMENYWGFQWRRYTGDINDNGHRKIKLCYGNEDGSTTFDYNTDGTGYVDVGATPSGTNNGYINKMKFTHDGMYSQVSSGSSSTHYCDGQWFNNAQVNYALRGGYSVRGLRCGALCVSLDGAPSFAGWVVGAALEYK